MADGKVALIVGAGSGLSASIARLCAADGMAVALAGRTPGKLDALMAETGASAHACDAGEPDQVDALFDAVAGDHGTPDLVVFNPSARARGPLVELDRDAVRNALLVTCYGGFLVGQAAAARMAEHGSGAIFFTGASASVKGYAQSAPFAMGKFGLRGLAQSMARELQPQNIHVAHFVIDGGIARSGLPDRGEDAWLEPDAIAETYMHIYRQHRSAWSWEVELRPWVENF